MDDGFTLRRSLEIFYQSDKIVSRIFILLSICRLKEETKPLRHIATYITTMVREREREREEKCEEKINEH